MAVLLAAKGGPSLLLRCARFLITHYLTRPGPSSACYDGWIRVTSGMIRRKYSGYRESRRESRVRVICAGSHGNEAVADWSVRHDGGDSQAGLVVPQVGLEPTTHGYALDFCGFSLLATLVILDVLAHLPALPLMPALPALPATPALPLLPAADAGSRHFRVDGNVEDHEHSTSSCLGTTDPSHVGGAR